MPLSSLLLFLQRRGGLRTACRPAHSERSETMPATALSRPRQPSSTDTRRGGEAWPVAEQPAQQRIPPPLGRRSTPRYTYSLRARCPPERRGSPRCSIHIPRPATPPVACPASRAPRRRSGERCLVRRLSPWPRQSCQPQLGVRELAAFGCRHLPAISRDISHA